MTDKESPDDESRNEFKQSTEASKVAIKSGSVAIWSFIAGLWKWIERQHPFVQLIFTLPVAYAMQAVFTPFADWFYTIFWEQPVVIEGYLYISGIPIPVSWMFYILLLLLVVTMLSNHHNKKQIQELRSELSE